MIENRFKIIVACYNCKRYISGCISSLVSQSYSNYKCIVIDDASEDNTLYLAKACVKDSDDRFIFKRNKVSIKGLNNYVNYIPFLCDNDDDSIIVTLDGDDLLANNNVLEYLNEVYQDENLMLTYGQSVCRSDVNKGGSV